ncbi:MAG TPA: ester cyclase [Mucilaginibacter sp.]|nr:ester cyclase [Mucilaginibacter sp.]
MKKLLVLMGVAVFATSCNSGNSPMMNNGNDSVAAAYAAKDSVLEKNKATALASVQAFSSGKLDEAFKDVTPDAVDYGDGGMAPIKGRDTIISMVKGFLSAFPDYKAENLMVVGDGNHVAVFGDYSGTFKKPLMGIKPTGKSFKYRDVDLFTFNDAGKITEHRSIQSGKTMMDMVGAKMPK